MVMSRDCWESVGFTDVFKLSPARGKTFGMGLSSWWRSRTSNLTERGQCGRDGVLGHAGFSSGRASEFDVPRAGTHPVKGRLLGPALAKW